MLSSTRIRTENLPRVAVVVGPGPPFPGSRHRVPPVSRPAGTQVSRASWLGFGNMPRLVRLRSLQAGRSRFAQARSVSLPALAVAPVAGSGCRPIRRSRWSSARQFEILRPNHYRARRIGSTPVVHKLSSSGSNPMNVPPRFGEHQPTVAGERRTNDVEPWPRRFSERMDWPIVVPPPRIRRTSRTTAMSHDQRNSIGIRRAQMNEMQRDSVDCGS